MKTKDWTNLSAWLLWTAITVGYGLFMFWITIQLVIAVESIGLAIRV